MVEHILRISELDDWKAANPDYEQVIVGAPGLVSDVKSPLTRAGKDWQDHLANIKKGSGSGSTIKT